MKDKEKDKRLIIPGDAFEEEASEGLGRLSRKEAEADLRELKGRMEMRLRKPRMIWLPAAAAVVILLVASALYVSIFRDRGAELTDIVRAEEANADSLLIAMADEAEADSELSYTSEKAKSDTALIAMAEPIHKQEFSSVLRESSTGPGAAGVTAERKSSRIEDPADRDSKKAVAEAGENVPHKVIAGVKEEAVAEYAIVEAVEEEISANKSITEAFEEEAVAEEVIVEVLPMMQKAALRADDAAKERAAARPDVAGQGIAVQGAIVPDRDASPVGGIEEFREWVTRNIRYPEGVGPIVRQVVVVTFRVRADSTVYDLKAERTAGDLFTREAFRLIGEGPKWTPAVRGGQAVEEEVRVSVVFK